MIVEGRYGGLPKNSGKALFERTVYDEGQLLSASFMDYALPRASDLPMFDSETDEPAVHPATGRKGCGEGEAKSRRPRRDRAPAGSSCAISLQTGGSSVNRTT
jgi:carbon-monoxide dehydrogenase large subunit